jgi:hypothetical protein
MLVVVSSCSGCLLWRLFLSVVIYCVLLLFICVPFSIWFMCLVLGTYYYGCFLLLLLLMVVLVIFLSTGNIILLLLS